MSESLALVQTVDFFAPIVDDPYLFGQVAAANALSDVYAMGGEPLTALNIVGWPSGKLPIEVLGDILRGAQDKVHEAGAVTVGGHTIIDDEVKFGLSVTGRVDPRRMLTNASAVPGDRLVLTKAIGTGLLATAEKQGTIASAHAHALHEGMRTLNALASRAAIDLGATCATDVTGFGVLGHANNIARASHVTIRIVASLLPVLAGAREAYAAGIRTGGAERNHDHLEPQVEWGSTSEVDRALLLDPQTSGGLLVALPANTVAAYLSRVPGAVEVGEVLPAGALGLVVS